MHFPWQAQYKRHVHQSCWDYDPVQNRESGFQQKINLKKTGVRTTFGSSDVASRGRRKGLCTLSKRKQNVRVLQHFQLQPPLHHTTLQYITLHYNYNYNYTYTPLHYTALNYTQVHYTTLHYTTLHSTTLHYITLHYTTFHYTSLHYTTLHSTTTLQLQLHNYTPLHSTTLNYTPLPVGRQVGRQIIRERQRNREKKRKREKERRPQAPFSPSVASLCHP